MRKTYFCFSWDHHISKESGVSIQKNDIYTKINTELHRHEIQQKRDEMSRGELAILYLIRLVINLFVLACLGGVAVGIFYLNSEIVPQLLVDYCPRGEEFDDTLTAVKVSLRPHLHIASVMPSSKLHRRVIEFFVIIHEFFDY